MTRVLIESEEDILAPLKVADWIYVWAWCRFKRVPRLFDAFPQQKGWCDDGRREMSAERYEELRYDWLLAGAPRDLSPLSAFALDPPEAPQRGDGQKRA